VITAILECLHLFPHQVVTGRAPRRYPARFPPVRPVPDPIHARETTASNPP
jgi:hypothetical protein